MDTKTVDPKDASALNGLGLALAAQERFDDAIEQYRKADALWEKDQSDSRKFALNNWGTALRSKKLYEGSAEKYREANTVDPNVAAAFNGLGLALAAQERFDDAIEQYRKADALAQSDDRKLALNNWGDALRSKKLYEGSAE